MFEKSHKSNRSAMTFHLVKVRCGFLGKVSLLIHDIPGCVRLLSYMQVMKKGKPSEPLQDRDSSACLLNLGSFGYQDASRYQGIEKEFI